MDSRREQMVVRELKRKRDPVSQMAAELIEDMQERLAIRYEGRVLVDGGDLAREFMLLSAAAGGMTGQAVLEACEKILTEAKRIW